MAQSLFSPTAPFMRNTYLLAALVAALSTATASAQHLFKCTNEKGQTTFSDRACEQAPRPAPPAPPAAKPAAAPAAKASTAAAAATAAGKAQSATPNAAQPATPPVTQLTPAVVEGVLQRALELADRSDYRAQCALAAPDLNFKLTDHSSSPAGHYSGGRAEICALQRQSAQAMQEGGLRSASRMNKPDIRVAADGTQATAKYESRAAISVEGQHAVTLHCTREEVLGLYSGVVLYKRVTAVCRPVG